MARIGVIGTGSMGSMLIRKFIESGAISADRITASNRSPGKVKVIAAETGRQGGEGHPERLCGVL